MVKKLKSGYTTGSTAAAAAKIAVKTLFTGTRVDSINIDTPKGIELTIKANYTTPDGTESYVIKNFSDDPDVTRGIKIYAKAKEISELLDMGIDGIMTDSPELLKNEVAKKGISI